MLQKFKLENNTGTDLQICIEPVVEFFDWKIGEVLEIEFLLKTDKYQDEIDLVLTAGYLVIYECRQYQMQLNINNQIKYRTLPDQFDDYVL